MPNSVSGVHGTRWNTLLSEEYETVDIKLTQSKTTFLATLAIITCSIAIATPSAIAQEEKAAKRKPSLVRLEQVIACINEPNPEFRKKFLSNGFKDDSSSSIDERTEILTHMRGGLAGLKIDKLVRAEEYRVIANCKSDNGSVIEIFLELTKKEPFLIKDISLETIKSVVSKGDYRDVKKLPDDLSGKMIGDFLKAFNTRDAKRITQFLSDKSTFTAKEKEGSANRFHEASTTTGGFEFYSIRKYEINEPGAPLVAIVRGIKSRTWHATVIELSPENKITVLKIADARAPTDLATTETITRTKAFELIAEYVESLRDLDSFSGVILVAQDDEIQIQQAMGFASRRFKVQNNLETKFNLVQ